MLAKRAAVALSAGVLLAAAFVAGPAHAEPDSAAGDVKVAPYIDITMESPRLTDVAEATGQMHYTLAFVLGSHAGCDPKWGGVVDLREPRIVDQIDQLRAAGGDVVVASGGALGPYLENVCGSVDDLYNAYSEILDVTGANHLDVDVEASIPYQRVNAALKRLQDDRGTKIAYTLRVQGQDYGVDPFSLQILQDAAAQGVDVAVNPMLMNFGYTGDWGGAMIDAAEATLDQMRGVWPQLGDAELKSRLGVTPMIGRNDAGMTTTQTHARALLSWAQANDIGFIGFWSVGRDNGDCPDGRVSPVCSGISQSRYEFTGIFRPFGA
ncbi:MAG: chitinase [Stackebrandtia sp.]